MGLIPANNILPMDEHDHLLLVSSYPVSRVSHGAIPEVHSSMYRPSFKGCSYSAAAWLVFCLSCWVVERCDVSQLDRRVTLFGIFLCLNRFALTNHEPRRHIAVCLV